MSERERLKLVRKTLKLNQKDFGSALGLTQGGYSDIERGKNKVSPRLKFLLKEKFQINLVWFETGEGEMYEIQIEESNDPLFDIQTENENLEFLKSELLRTKEQVNRLQVEINLYKEILSSKDKAIEALEGQLKNK